MIVVLLFRHSAKALPPSTPKLLELTATCVHDFEKDNAEEKKQSQYTINTFEAVVRHIQQNERPVPQLHAHQKPKRELMRPSTKKL